MKGADSVAHKLSPADMYLSTKGNIVQSKESRIPQIPYVSASSYLLSRVHVRHEATIGACRESVDF